MTNSNVHEGSIRKHLTFKNTNAIQVYTHPTPETGALYLEENALLFIISGKIIMGYGAMEEQACNSQLIFLKKEILIAYKMEASEDGHPVEYILFNVRADVVTEFAKMADLSVPIPQQFTPFVIANTDEKFSSFISSIQVCKFYPENVQSRLNKIKLIELLFYIASYKPAIIGQLLQLRKSFQTDITSLIEENILNSISLQQLALLAGRSLSSFRRDFLSIYNMPPSQWIRNRRLEKAKELLSSTTMSVTDICYTTGFENIAHFSRLFKSYYRASPSQYRQALMTA